MRYFVRDSTLFLRGDFSAASTGVEGGIRRVSTILNHTVPADFHEDNPRNYLERIVTSEGYSLESFFGLLTAVGMQNLCILQYDFITAFITAGIEGPHTGSGTINIIIFSGQGLSTEAQLESIMTVTEAKVKALQARGYPFTGTPTDAVVIASEGALQHPYAGTLTEPGKRIYSAVEFGVGEALRRQKEQIERMGPFFFIFSRYGGEHWVEWRKDECAYYPCHFEGQRCDFCYCPLYPCLEVGLGQWVESSSGGDVWSCSTCTLLHEPEIAEYLKKNPEASVTELKMLARRLKK